MNTINKQLNTLFSQHRLFFWYDEGQEFRQDFEDLERWGNAWDWQIHYGRWKIFRWLI